MLLKTLIIAIILVAIIMLALGIKLLFNKNAEFRVHPCALREGTPDDEGVCPKCELRDLKDCPENKDDQKQSGESN